MLGDSVRRRQPRRSAAGRAYGPRFWILSVLAALLVPGALGYVVAAFFLFPKPDTEGSGMGIPVPALRGLSAVAAERALAQANLGRLQVTELPSGDTPEGEIIAQSPLAGQQLRAGAAVRVAVSTGAPRVKVPDVLGDAAERAEQTLRRAGLEVLRAESESPVAKGRVFAVDPAPGTEVRLPGRVTMRVSLGPPAVDSTLLLPPAPTPDTLPRPR